VNAKAKDAWNVRLCSGLRHGIVECHEENVRKSGAEEGAVDVPLRGLAVVHFSTPRAEHFDDAVLWLICEPQLYMRMCVMED